MQEYGTKAKQVLALLMMTTMTTFTLACAEEASPPSTEQPMQGDIELGAYLASTCASCHNKNGPSSGIPNIAHLSNVDLTNALNAYKTGVRQNTTMRTIANGLSDEDILALTAYFASQRNTKDEK